MAEPWCRAATTDESEGLSGVSSQAASEPPVGSASTTTTSRLSLPGSSSDAGSGQPAASARAEVVDPSPPITIIAISALPVRRGGRRGIGIIVCAAPGDRRVTGLDVGDRWKQDHAHDLGSRHVG